MMPSMKPKRYYQQNMMPCETYIRNPYENYLIIWEDLFYNEIKQYYKMENVRTDSHPPNSHNSSFLK